MQKIEFRAYSEERGEYIFGNLVSCSFDFETHYFITDNRCVETMVKPIPIVNDTIGQFTGFRDIDNVEIYEGDILKQTRNRNRPDYKVIRSAMSAAFVLVPTNLKIANDSFMVLTEVFVQSEGLKVDLSIYDEKKQIENEY